jgi:hypothetical protein
MVLQHGTQAAGQQGVADRAQALGTFGMMAAHVVFPENLMGDVGNGHCDCFCFPRFIK